MRKILLFIAILFFSLTTRAQETKNRKQPGIENFFVGGSVSLGLGIFNRQFIAGLHPHFGYTLAKWIDVAMVLNFEYSSIRDEFNDKYHNTTYGTGAFIRIYPVNFLFLQAEPEYNFIDLKYIPDQGNIQKLKINAPSLLIGAGYVTEREDKNTFSYISLLIDVLKDPNSPYIDGNGRFIPVIRAGLNIGLRKKQKRWKH